MLAEVSLLAADCSPEALDLARENAVAHSAADAIVFTEADLVPAAEAPFDVILANLPYIPSAEIDRLPVAASFEPRLALDGGPDGLAIVRRLLEALPATLAPDGVALLEIGFDQGTAVGEAVAALEGEWSCLIQPDLSGNPRLAHVERSIGSEALG
jgi:release factor glutamine methyltransferase